MKIVKTSNAEELGQKAAVLGAQLINDAIAAKGEARIVLSTGMSQFETLQALVQQPVDWSKVEMFHLDEYADMPVTHPASFRKYLQERFLAHAPVAKAHLVDGESDREQVIETLTKEIRKAPIDVAYIGIGENAHIAFNDPPADFDTKEAFIVVDLDERCRQQQAGEGWFDSPDDVPKQAITMTAHQIMQAKAIISAVPHAVKADAIHKTLTQDVTNEVPATLLKTHPQWVLFVDQNSAKDVDPALLAQFS